MALHPEFPRSPYAPLVPSQRWFPADETLRTTSYDKLLPPLVAKIRDQVHKWLFGEPNPLGDQYRSWLPELGAPFAPLGNQRVPEEIARPTSKLLLVDALVGSGRIARVTKSRLGGDVAGKRRMELGWETGSRYSNDRPQRREASGYTTL